MDSGPAQTVPAPLLRRLLWSGLALVGILLVSGGGWLWLQAAGDRGAADGIRGVLAVSGLALALDVLALVVVLAYAELMRSSRPAAGGTDSPVTGSRAAPPPAD